MDRKVSHLRDELRKTFALYALLPTVIISILGFFLALAYWHTNVLERNRHSEEAACNAITAIVTRQMEKVNEIAAMCDIQALKEDAAARTRMYESLYQYVGALHMEGDFYVFDEQMNRLVSNQNQEPEYIRLTRAADWGIIGQLKQKPAVPAFSFVSSMKNPREEIVFVAGKAIVEKGKVAGYVVFTLPAPQLAGRIESPYVQTVVKDRYNYAVICRDAFFADDMNKMKPEFKEAEGYFSLEGRKYYVSRQDVLNGELTVYSFTFIGGMVSQLTYAVLILIGVLCILSLSIIISVKKQVDEKTKMIDQLVEAFSAVKEGNLDTRLTIRTNNEFEIIGEAYNMMLESLKDLMRTSEEKARATVISEIKQLESQFNPHFLFNTLENIKFMIKLDPAAASRMIVALSSLLRYSIDNDGGEVTVAEDMEYTRNYLEIQKLRFGTRLDFAMKIAEEVQDCIVPKLIIQPIIENAIKYGFRDCQHMEVSLTIEMAAGQLVIVIQNNGTEIEAQTLADIQRMLGSSANLSRHSGMYNVNRRIQLMYGKDYGLQISSGCQEGTTVTLRLPVCRKGSGRNGAMLYDGE